MPRPLRKTAATSLKMTPEVRDLWERCAEAESRSLPTMFEVMVRAHAKKLNLAPAPAAKGQLSAKNSAAPRGDASSKRIPSNPKKK
jgi:hypothetical protein